MLALAGVILAMPVQVFSLGKRDAGKAPRTEAAPDQRVSALENPGASPASDAALYGSAVSGQSVEVSGRVRLVGNEPFSDLVLTDSEEHTWYIDPADRKTLSSYEQQTVTIRGVVELKEMALANGKSLGSRRTLSGVILVKVW
ncbi:hypothetical protein FACS189450_06750 [Spirochaetia bacterium]|nr:hypothetical protein FACS189450_06750 [Spirochaetia bacterium]GHU94102.1 hypothetical protein FACS189479_06420 [Spirochaetia bacterium]